ncbi:Uncharacterised protein [Klebsiella pneumoniae]|nr:Uncharacterised protein [Klebsiella pneumoniae]
MFWFNFITFIILYGWAVYHTFTHLHVARVNFLKLLSNHTSTLALSLVIVIDESN